MPLFELLLALLILLLLNALLLVRLLLLKFLVLLILLLLIYRSPILPFVPLVTVGFGYFVAGGLLGAALGEVTRHLVPFPRQPERPAHPRPVGTAVGRAMESARSALG